MREVVSTVTRKGQVTIPVEIRRLLGVAPPDKVAFVVEGRQVWLVRSRSVVERTAGLLRSDAPSLPADELRDASERAIAEETVRRSGSEP